MTRKYGTFRKINGICMCVTVCVHPSTQWDLSNILCTKLKHAVEIDRQAVETKQRKKKKHSGHILWRKNVKVIECLLWMMVLMKTIRFPALPYKASCIFLFVHLWLSSHPPVAKGACAPKFSQKKTDGHRNLVFATSAKYWQKRINFVISIVFTNNNTSYKQTKCARV